MRSNNPALRADIFQRPQRWDDLQGSRAPAAGAKYISVGSKAAVAEAVATRAKTMTLQGSVNASFILLGLTMTTSIIGWSMLSNRSPALMPALMGGGIGSLIIALVLFFNQRSAPILAPCYALLKGLTIGAISAMYAERFKGDQIVLQAGVLTFGIFLALLLAYTSGVIKATENFKLGVVAATGGVFFLMLATLILRLFGLNVPYIWDSSPIGIGIAAVIVVIAALNLVLDFDFIEEGANNGLPKYMEWYAAFGLLVTLIWLYFSILRLLALLQSDD